MIFSARFQIGQCVLKAGSLAFTQSLVTVLCLTRNFNFSFAAA